MSAPISWDTRDGKVFFRAIFASFRHERCQKRGHDAYIIQMPEDVLFGCGACDRVTSVPRSRYESPEA